MDIKKISLNIKLSDLKLTGEYKKKLVGLLIKNLRLFFLVFLGAITIYSFNIIFKKAYVEINYIQYAEYRNALADTKGRTMLEKITQSIEERKKSLENVGDKHYIDPFSFRDDANSEKTGAEDGKEEAAVVGSGGGTVKNGTGLRMIQ